MAEYDNLQQALIMAMYEEVRIWEEAANAEPHVFSHDFEAKMQRLIARKKSGIHARREATGRDYKPAQVKVLGHMMRRSVAVLLAAILVLATAAVALAITKPEIFLIIKENLKNWDISPVQENEEGVSTEFVPIEPEAPEGYEKTEENYGYINEKNISCEIVYKDTRDNIIIYSQTPVNGKSSAGFNIDAEGYDIYRETIDGYDMVIGRHDDNETTIILEDDKCVYSLYGECSFEQLYKMAESIITDKE